MRAVLGDIDGGGHTLDELELAPLARRAGLSAPRRQALRRERGGRVRYVDAEFDLPDGQLLIVEVDGAVHQRPETMWDDMTRQNELIISGSTVLRFSSVDIRLDQEHVVDQLRRVRAAHA
jgi:very-short-patch-repair endonuclease